MTRHWPLCEKVMLSIKPEVHVTILSSVRHEEMNMHRSFMIISNSTSFYIYTQVIANEKVHNPQYMCSHNSQKTCLAQHSRETLFTIFRALCNGCFYTPRQRR